MGRVRRIVAFGALLMCVAVVPLRAQYVLESHESTSFTRRQLAVGPMRVIYRAGADSLARVVARWTALYKQPTALSPQRDRLFPIIMWGQTVIPNGMVAWTPSRMELYPLSGGEERTPVPWLQHLVSHEIRHYAQMEGLDRKFIRALYYLFGQQNMGVGGLVAPPWFLEGDAIHSESKYTLFGRAHSAEHLQAYRADLLDGQELCYDQYRFGSWRYNVPNHYSFGTMVVEYSTARYGETLWPRVLEYSAKYPILLNPFKFALRKYVGRNSVGLFHDAMFSADSIFIASTEYGERPVPVARGAFFSEREPWMPDSSGIRYVWRYDKGHTLAFYRVDTAGGARRVLFRPGAKLGMSRYGDSCALWIEAVRHPRWGDVVWGDVYSFSLSTGKRERVTRRQRLLSPVPLRGDSTFAAIALASNGSNYVVRYSLSDGRALDTALLPRPVELRELARGRGSDEVLVRGVDARGMYVVSYDWRAKRADTLLGPVVLDVGSLTSSDGGFFFTLSHNGRQQPFFARRDARGAVDRFYRVAMRNHGVDDLHAARGGGLDYSEYTVNGYRARRAFSLDLRPLDSLPQAQTLFPLDQENVLGAAARSADEPLASRPYHPLLHSVRVHSWTPFYFNPFDGAGGLSGVHLGAAITSQNTTGSLAFSLGYFYNDRHGASLTAVWQGWWPVITANVTYGGDLRRTMYGSKTLYGPHSVAASLSAGVPLFFRRGAVALNVRPHLSFSFRNDAVRDSSTGQQTDGFFYAGYGMSFSALRIQAQRDLYPRYGVRVHVNGRSTVRPAMLVGPFVEGGGTVYVPGVAVNHSLRLSGYAAKSFRASYVSVFTMPVRGLAYNFPTEDLQATSGWSAAVDYAFPLGYPDWSFLGCLYVQRFYANLAFSYTRYVLPTGAAQQKRAFYLDLVSNLHLFRFGMALTVGASVGYSFWHDTLGPQPWGPWSLKGIFNVGL